MQKRDTSRRRQARPARGIVRGPAVPGAHLRTAPLAPLDAFIEHFWAVTWDLTGRPRREVQTLPHPSIHVVIEGDRHELAGVQTRRFSRWLEARGSVFGVKFRPAMFSTLLEGPVAALLDRVLEVGEVWGRAGHDFASAVAREDDHDARVALAERYFLGRLGEPAPEAVRLRDLVERAAVDRSLVKVEHLAEAAGVSQRTLERQFRQHVGVKPKWVLQRYRLHEANERLKADPEANLAELALELGYVDQSHFVRDFKAMLGVTPGAYARRDV